ncbi:hypothetical protein [Rhizobium aegyptiacum]|uniref:hypothetical protein n=1 Tax=Rhizobium aegyptiacum TaxID=1764550 RepID=UPI0012E8F84C|nr:hypothetical protein [Rhizobium aegyptiacum]
MTAATLMLSFDIARLDGMLSALTEAADLFPEVRQGLVSLLDSQEELFSLDSNFLPASITGELLVLLQPSDALRRLMAASRAGDADLRIFEHATSPVGRPELSTTSESRQ